MFIPLYRFHSHSRQKISDVAKGLCYLHARNVIHGDLKGVRSCYNSRLVVVLTPNQPNILVDDSGHALIADFGLATVTQNLDSVQSASYHHGHTARWTAPEILSGGKYSKEADIFSFAMVMTEVLRRWSIVGFGLPLSTSIQAFTGAMPFSGSSTVAAMLSMAQGKRPQRPTHPAFTENLWTLMQRCWDHDPRLRPEISDVLQLLLASSVSCSLWKRSTHKSDCVFVCSDPPAWQRLINYTRPTPECTDLITSIFSDRNEIDVVKHLSGDDAQTFIDAVNEVSYPLSLTKNGSVDPHQNPRALSVRRWIASHNKSTGRACDFCPAFVAVKPYFPNLCKFHFVTTQWEPHIIAVDSRTCGGAIITTRGSRPRL